MDRTFFDFKDIEADFSAVVPPLLYKYRTWENLQHQKIITQKEVWFAHPFTLNDPYDVRPPYEIIIPETIDWGLFRQRLENIGRMVEPDLTEVELQRQVDIRLRHAQTDPVDYFTKTREQYILNEANYDRIGVFSCCTSGLNEPMWAHYGNNHNGFAIGFHSANLARALYCRMGFVGYSDQPIRYTVLGDNTENMSNEVFQKSSRWAPEEEFRFLSAGIGFSRQRSAQFPTSAVAEILVGTSTTNETISAIKTAASIHLPGVPMYRVARQNAAYGFRKVAV